MKSKKMLILGFLGLFCSKNLGSGINSVQSVSIKTRGKGS